MINFHYSSDFQELKKSLKEKNKLCKGTMSEVKFLAEGRFVSELSALEFLMDNPQHSDLVSQCVFLTICTYGIGLTLCMWDCVT